MKVKNLFANPGRGTVGEELLTLFESANVKIERIVSHSSPSPTGFWYDQDDDEWVIVLRGTAILEFADGKQVELREGDYLTLARHVKHRVARTDAETIWLAVYIR